MSTPESLVDVLLGMISAQEAIRIITRHTGDAGEAVSHDHPSWDEFARFICLEDVPENGRIIIKTIGIDASIELFKRSGGQHINIPRTSQRDCDRLRKLVSLIGFDAAEKLISMYSGTMLYVPKCSQALSNARNRMIISLYDGGVSINSLSQQFSISDRRVEIILSKNY